MPDRPDIDEAQTILDALDETAPFALFAVQNNTIDGRVGYGEGEAQALGRMQLALLGAHIRAVADALDADQTPADAAEKALRVLADMETDGHGYTLEKDV